MGSLNRLSIGHLGHAANASTSQTRILVAVAPAVDCALDQASLSAERRVELGQCPAHRVALRLVLQPVSAVLVLRAASARVDAVLRLEVARELVRVDRLDIAADSVLHLDAVARVFKCNPLHPIVILPHHERCRSWDGARGGVLVDAGRGAAGRREGTRSVLLLVLGSAQGTRGRSLQLWRHLSLDLGVARAVQTLLRVLAGVLLDWVLRARVRHHHVRLRRHGVLGLLRVLLVGRGRGLLRHRGILLLSIVHGLLLLDRRGCAIDAAVLVMSGWRCDGGGRVRLWRMIYGRIRSRHLRCGHHVGGVYFTR